MCSIRGLFKSNFDELPSDIRKQIANYYYSLPKEEGKRRLYNIQSIEMGAINEGLCNLDYFDDTQLEQYIFKCKPRACLLIKDLKKNHKLKLCH